MNRILLPLLALCLVLPSEAGWSQDDLFTPSKPASPSEEPVQPEPDKPVKPDKPAPDNTASLVGTWIANATGGSMCAPLMTVQMKAKSGTIDNKGYIGTFTVTRNGSGIALNNSYTSVFGKLEYEVWQGTVAADGRSISGTILGSWADGCKFVMRKQ
jgi:hypothetical protein